MDEKTYMDIVLKMQRTLYRVAWSVLRSDADAADAVQEAKDAADFVCSRPGGRGCLREGIEMIMKAQGKWRFDEDKFDQIY